jgi:hypothetical protein
VAAAVFACCHHATDPPMPCGPAREKDRFVPRFSRTDQPQACQEGLTRHPFTKSHSFSAHVAAPSLRPAFPCTQSCTYTYITVPSSGTQTSDIPRSAYFTCFYAVCAFKHILTLAALLPTPTPLQSPSRVIILTPQPGTSLSCMQSAVFEELP